MAIHFTEEEKKEFMDNPSEIYQKRTRETEKRDIENLSRQDKWQHFRDYYLKVTIAAVVIVCLLVTFAVKAATRKPSRAIYIVIQQDVLDEDIVELFRRALEKHMKLDTDMEEVVVDIGCTDQQLQAYFYAGTADILITSEEHFQKWSRAKYFFDAETDKEVAFYGDYDEKYRFRTKYITAQDVLNNKETAKTEEGSDQTEYNCGLYLTDSEKYGQLKTLLDKPVIGISTTTKRLTEAREFVQYMMDNTQKMELETEAAQ